MKLIYSRPLIQHEFDPGSVSCQASLVAQTVKKLPAIQKTQVRDRGQKDNLEKRMVTQSSILVWKIPWTEELCGLQSLGLQRIRHDWATNTLPLPDSD